MHPNPNTAVLQQDILTLDQACPGHYRVDGIHSIHDLRMRLAAMGLRKGEPVQVLVHNRTGAVVQAGETRLALGNELLKAIRVTPG